MSRFRSLVLDVDSTLSGIEGIDWLAARRSPDSAAESELLTARAMSGELPFAAVYAQRLQRVRPTRVDLAELAKAYRDTVAPGAHAVVQQLVAAGIVIHVVSGGLREAIIPFAAWLGIPADRVHAVELRWDAGGQYDGFEAGDPLTRSDGKATVVRALRLPEPLLAVGDGITDLALREAGATFVAFTGFVRRDAVVRGADHVISSFAELHDLVLT